VNASDTAPGETWVRADNIAGACALNYKYGPYVGTAATARDFMSVVDALGQDGLLHYYGKFRTGTARKKSIAKRVNTGGSYGTALGATLAAMFPDRIGHIVVDGVIDATEYYHNPA
jgi:pimeloyl-ACP methyl ester carboxylesterase